MRAGGSYVSSTHTEIMSAPTLNFYIHAVAKSADEHI